MMKNVSACNMTAAVSRQRQLMMSFLNWSWRKVSTMNSNELIFVFSFFMFSTHSTNFTLLLVRVYWCNNFNHQMLTAWKNVRSIVFHNRSQHDYEIVCSIAAQFLNFLICSTHSESWSFFSSHRKKCTNWVHFWSSHLFRSIAETCNSPRKERDRENIEKIYFN